MKIEMEIDEGRIYTELVDKLFQHMKYEIEKQVDQAMKGEAVFSLGQEIRRIVKEKLPTLTLNDGRSLEQYLSDVLSKKSSGDFRVRSRLEGIVDNAIVSESHRLFAEIVKPFVQDFKKGLVKNLVERTIHALTEEKDGG
jgi:hypothetical protein